VADDANPQLEPADQEREAQLREAQRIAGIGSWEWVPGSDVITWSEGMFLILGRPVDQGPPTFANLPHYYTPESWQRLGAAIARALETGAPYELELVMIRGDAGTCWTATRGEAVRGPGGAVMRLRGTVHDITARKRAEKAYQEREAQLREAQRIAGIGSWEHVLGTDLVSWSEGLHLILGRDLALGAPTMAELPQHYAPESWARLREAITRTIEAGVPYELELAMIRNDGRTCWTTTRGEAVRGPDGTVVSLRGTVHDITERKRAERAYHERETQLREAQRIAGIGSWERKLGDNSITWSEGMHLIVGRPLALGPPTFAALAQYYTPESWARLQQAITSAVAGVPYELELEMIRSDGRMCWTTTRGEAVRGPDGSVVSLRGTVHDITERKRLQAVTAQSDRLSSMGLLAAGVAHELNNPLTYVRYNVESLTRDLPRLLGAAARCATVLQTQLGDTAFAAAVGDGADLLRAPSLLDDVVDRAREAAEGTQRISGLIRSLGTFSRVEKVEEAAVDLTHAIESAINMAQNELRFRARLVKDLGVVPAVWASEGKLSQVFLNLLINAAHAIEEGHIEDNVIEIRTWAEGDHVFAEVADTGGGIQPADLDRVFDPFFSTKQIGKGSGLGLAICKNIVTAFGGDIWVKSEPGIGSCFTVRLPVKREVHDHCPDVEHAPPRPVGGRILVIDDEPTIRRTLQRVLGHAHDVVIAASGIAAREILERDQTFDVVLCDLMMPEMTGMELHAWLAATHPALSTRVVFITGGVFTPRAAEFLASVSNLRVQKPFELDTLEHLIAELMGSGYNCEN
jgi:PAS domain S-box-containing protein